MNKLISILDLNKEEVLDIIKLAEDIKIDPLKYNNTLKNKVVINAFFQESTRTRLSSSIAVKKLGGIVENIYEKKKNKDMNNSESFEDTMRVIIGYSDIINIRDLNEENVFKIKEISGSTIVNSGNGRDEHPTQTLIDLYTIWEEFNRLNNLKITIVGDLKNSRSAHSLIMGLSLFNNNKIKLVSPKKLSMPKKYLKKIGSIFIEEKEEFSIEDCDVLYMCGFSPVESNLEEMSRYDLTLELAKQINNKSIIMNPLPRITEIHKQVDLLPQAKYFEQSNNGIPIRMAIFSKLING